jgi:hypothetical protein
MERSEREPGDSMTEADESGYSEKQAALVFEGAVGETNTQARAIFDPKQLKKKKKPIIVFSIREES